MSMPTDPPLADPKVEMQHGQFYEKDGAAEATVPVTEN